jgi:hypothetical protein
MSQGREIELKLEVESGAAARLSAHPSLAAGPKKRTDQVSVYYDTPDGALREAGLSLRVRKAGDRHVQTVKQSAGTSAGLFDRPEWEWDVPGMEPDLDAAASTPLAAVLTKKVRKQLRPLIRVEAGRSLWMIEQDGTTIELILDEGKRRRRPRPRADRRGRAGAQGRRPSRPVPPGPRAGGAGADAARGPYQGRARLSARGRQRRQGHQGRADRAPSADERSGGVRRNRLCLPSPVPPQRADRHRAAGPDGAPSGPGGDAPAALRLYPVPPDYRR